MGDLLVLCYHALSERWPAALSVRPEPFEAQLRLLAKRGYRGATFTDAITNPRPGKTVVVTFDDAFLSVQTLALPILRSVGFPGTVFAVSDHAATGRPLSWEGTSHWEQTEHAHELAGMSWEQLGELAGEGWEIGSHTVTHPHLTRLGDDELAHELSASKTACEAALGAPVPSIAYPYGDVDERVVAATRAAGYQVAAALPARPIAPTELEWPRVGVYHVDVPWRFRMKVSPAVRRIRALSGR